MRYLSFLFCIPTFAANYYIATAGNDSNPGTIGLPFKTVTKANSVIGSCDTTNYNGGDVFDDALPTMISGTATCQTTITSYGSGTAIFSGATLITGSWTNVSGNIWSTPFSHTLGKPREVWANNVRCIRAKTTSGLPSGSTLIGSGSTATASVVNSTTIAVVVTAGGSAYSVTPIATVTGGTGTHGTVSVTVVAGAVTAITVAGASGYTGGDTLTVTIISAGYTTASSSNPGYLSTFANQADIEFIYRTNGWFEPRVPVASIVSNVITMVTPAFSNSLIVLNAQGQITSPTAIENAYEIFLANSTNGTFYQDRTADLLYLIAPGGANPNGLTVRVPVREVVINNTVDFVTISNIDIRHTTALQASTSEGFANLQGTAYVKADTTIDHLPGALQSSGRYVDINRVNFSALGGNAAYVVGPANSVSIRNCTFTDISASAVILGGMTGYGTFQTAPSMIDVYNNDIGNIGLEYVGADGILGFVCGSCHYHHNHVHDVPYSGISSGFGGKYFPGPDAGTSYTEVHHNHVENAMQVMNDGGGIYFNAINWMAKNYSNLVHDIGTGGALTQLFAFYMDDDSQSIASRDNVSYTIRNSGGGQAFFHNNISLVDIINTQYDTGTFLQVLGGTAPTCGGVCPGSNTAVGLGPAITAGAALNAGVLAPAPNPYSYAKSITLQSSVMGGADQQNFPWPICDTDSDLRTIVNGGKVTSSSGYDIILTMDFQGDYKLDHEIESYSPSTGNFCAWVRIPRAPTSGDLRIYRQYGNSSITTSQEVITSVWDRYFASVQHLTTMGGDSTFNAINFTNHGATATTGKIGGAANFNGTSHYMDWLNFPPLITGNTSTARYTMQAWARPAAISGNHWLFNTGITSGGGYSTIFGLITSGYSIFQFTNTDVSAIGASGATAGTWDLATAVYDGTNCKVYQGVTLKATTACTSLGRVTGFATYLGGHGTDGAVAEFWNGDIDESWLSVIARSDTWRAANFNITSDVPSSYVRGSEQSTTTTRRTMKSFVQ